MFNIKSTHAHAMFFCNLYERHLCDYELEQLCGLASFNTNIETAELEHRMKTKE